MRDKREKNEEVEITNIIKSGEREREEIKENPREEREREKEGCREI